jgi:hypothetical protein
MFYRTPQHSAGMKGPAIDPVAGRVPEAPIKEIYFPIKAKDKARLNSISYSGNSHSRGMEIFFEKGIDRI